MSDATVTELFELTQKLLDSIAHADWMTYKHLCAATLTGFEPESRGHLIEGMDFHQFYFDLDQSDSPVTTTMSAPHVRLLGTDVAVVSYIRLVQRLDESGQPQTSRCEETRVWHHDGDHWKHVHFHRSVNT